MHVYIYDAALGSQKFHQLLAGLETRLTDLGLSGKIVRLNPMHNLRKALQDEAKTDRTLIFVGSDKLFTEGLAALIDKEVTIGYLPVFPKQPIATALGIPCNNEACDVLAARRLERLDVGLANDQAFIGELEIESNHCLIDINNEIHIEVPTLSLLRIINLPLNTSTINNISPQDGLLDLSITTKEKSGLFKTNMGLSQFRSVRFTLNSDSFAILDHQISIQCPVELTLASKPVNVIVGKDRKF